MIYQLGDLTPQIAKKTFIAPNATLIGDVIIQANASIWFNVVIRADLAQVKIGENSNIQDGSILHVDENYPMNIDKNVTVGHKVMLHGCSIGENSLIGMNAVVLNGATIGKNCLVGANALITENMVIPDGHMAIGSPAKTIKPLDNKTIELLKDSAEHYVKNGQRYIKELNEIKMA